MTRHTIPAAVAILTKNSAQSVGRALESVKDFDEIIICDGGSTDNTLTLAQQYGAAIIKQDASYLDEAGRIADFGAVRNQTLAAAHHEWFLFLDSDEYLSADLLEEIRSIIDVDEKGVYWIPRQYVLHGTVIECATSYPSYQPRFFHKSVVQGFVKKVHERIQPKEGVAPRFLEHYMYVPIDISIAESLRKWDYYLGIEYRQRYPMSFRRFVSTGLRELAIGVLYLWRLIKIQFLCKGTKLPIRVELLRPWYQCALVWTLLRSVRRW